MSRVDPDAFFAPREDRHETVARELARIGLSLTDSATKLVGLPAAPVKSTAQRLAEQDAREGVFAPPGSVPISLALAEQMHYRRPTAPADPADVDAEAESLEGLRHG
jgi:hypothetical protein